MAKKGKIYPFQLASAYGVFQAVHGNAHRIGEYFQRKFRRNRDVSHEHKDVKGRDIPSRIRLLFLVIAFPVVIISLMLVMLALMEGDSDPHLTTPTHSVTEKFKRLVQDYNSFVLFVATSSAVINIVAILGAIFNWPTVLFAYVVITGLVGTVVGVMGLIGIVITCVLMSHKSASDHSIAITVIVVIVLVLIFYMLTIIGLKLMAIVRRKSSNYDPEARSPRPYKGSPINRRVKRSSYKSIDRMTSPFSSQDSDEQELSQVYVDKSLLNSPSQVSEQLSPYPFSFQV